MSKRGNKIVRFFSHGGIVSPGDLRSIAHFSYRNGDGIVHFGIRQDVMVEVDSGVSEREINRSLKSVNIDYEISTDFNSRNIGSSLVTLDLFPGTVWLKSDVYFDILESIGETPSLKVNITDPEQGLVALFKGNLNFIASDIPGLWYLSLEFSWARKRVFWPDYVGSEDIARLVKLIEGSDALQKKEKIKGIIAEVLPQLKNAFPKIPARPEFPKKRFPNYDGFHKYGDRYWLGLFNRNNSFSARFIEELSWVASQTKAGNIFITPWNSILIKEITEGAVAEWEKLLGKYGVNVQHSSVELNWQVPSLDKKANKLKKYITGILNKYDVRTYGLTFGIRTRPVFISTSVIIRKSRRSLLGRNYTVIYSESFNPNNSDFKQFGGFFSKRQLPKVLVELCKAYNRSLLDEKSGEVQMPERKGVPIEIPNQNYKSIYECEECFTIYDPDQGDPVNGIEAGTPFHKLPDGWCCSVCEAEKTTYQPRHIIDQEEPSSTN